MTSLLASPATGWRAVLLPIHVLLFALQVSVLLPLRLGLILLGLPVVPLALMFRLYDPGTAVAFTQYPGAWQLVTLPRWAWPWSNDRDGLLGDKRGWWAANCDAEVLFGLLPWLRRPSIPEALRLKLRIPEAWSERLAKLGLPIPIVAVDSALAMFWWAAVRNPANNLRFTRLFGCPVLSTACRWWGSEIVEDDPGKGGCRFLLATDGIVPFYGLYWVYQWSEARALVVQIGFKGEPSDWKEDYAGDEQRQWKGFTFEINPAKNIG